MPSLHASYWSLVPKRFVHFTLRVAVSELYFYFRKSAQLGGPQNSVHVFEVVHFTCFLLMPNIQTFVYFAVKQQFGTEPLKGHGEKKNLETFYVRT